ncbi:hypothetical protein D9M70_560370 [compost metagenome]
MAGLILVLVPFWIFAVLVYRSYQARAGRSLSTTRIWVENTLFVAIGLGLVWLAFTLD